MGKGNHIYIFIFLYLLIFCMMYSPVMSQVWWEETDQDYGYDLSDVRVLILLGEDFDYHETMVVKDHWEKWGAQIEIAGTANELTGHLFKRTKKGWDRSENRTIQMDMLFSEVDMSKYKILFLPGGSSPANMVKTDSLGLAQLVQEADQKGLVLAAICHGPIALTAADVVEGHKITGHRDVIKGVQEQKGEYVREVCVVDDNIITGNWPYFETFAVKVAEKILYPEGGGPSQKSSFDTNPVLSAIKQRRSIRQFQDKDVDQDTIELLLKAATWAPSANNDQPWKFVVVRDREVNIQIVDAVIERMKGAYEELGYPLDRIKMYWSGVFSAPVHIFAFCDTTGITIDEEFEEMEILHNMQGVSIACQNILLAAQALELGSLWVGGAMVVEDQIKNFLRVPEEVRLAAIIGVGYPAYKAFPPVRKPLSKVMYIEKWGEK
jgi:nitroreductase/putative intracellular protease/amidase